MIAEITNVFFSLGLHTPASNQCDICRILRHIILLDGPLGLYRGLLPTLAKSVPSSAINYVVFEIAQGYFKQYIH